MKRLIYGPPNWFVTRFDAEDRRAFAFYLIVASIIGAVFFGGAVFYVTLLSIFALFSNFTSKPETGLLIGF